MAAVLDAAALRHWARSGLDVLRAHQTEIDDLNVYPVPDSDTGTNLVLTMAASVDALAALADGDGGPRTVLAALAAGALRGARGNSGVILSQLLAGLASALPEGRVVTGRDLAVALRTAADSAYAAVAVPAEGTVLSVATAAAEAARAAAERTDDVAAVADAAAEAAATAVARTPSQLPALATAGVVDAGGRGLAVLLDALAAVLAGRPVHTAPLPRAPDPVVARESGRFVAERESGSEAYAYEVQYLLDAPPAAVAALKAELAVLGDSLVVVGDGEVWNVHVHVNDIGAAIEAGVRAGRPHRIGVTRFADQFIDRVAAATARRAVVALVAGDGLARLYAAAGATAVPADGHDSGAVLAAVLATGAAEVLLLADGAGRHALAGRVPEQAAGAGVTVAVVPTSAAVQGLAALAVHHPGRSLDADAAAMGEAATATRWGEVTGAPADPEEACASLVDRLLAGGGELVTLVCGADCPPGLGGRLADRVRRAYPAVEVTCHAGGQPGVLMVGVE